MRHQDVGKPVKWESTTLSTYHPWSLGGFLASNVHRFAKDDVLEIRFEGSSVYMAGGEAWQGCLTVYVMSSAVPLCWL